jgi:hypothetical protein
MANVTVSDKTEQRKIYGCPNGCNPDVFVQNGHIPAVQYFIQKGHLPAVRYFGADGNPSVGSENGKFVAEDGNTGISKTGDFVTGGPVVCPRCRVEATFKLQSVRTIIEVSDEEVVTP